MKLKNSYFRTQKASCKTTATNSAQIKCDDTIILKTISDDYDEVSKDQEVESKMRADMEAAFKSRRQSRRKANDIDVMFWTQSIGDKKRSVPVNNFLQTYF